MLDSIIKIAGTIPADQTKSDISSIDIPEDGFIWAMDGLIYCTGMADDITTADSMVLLAELSFLSTSQMGSNDARGELQEIGIAFYAEDSLGGAGAKCSEVRATSLNKGIPVQAGERLHAHGYSNLPNLTGAFSFLLYLETKGGGRRATRGR